MPRRAPFIVIEGLDRSGKTTQTALLVSRLEEAKVPVKLMKFPDRTTPIGQMINSYLQSKSDLDDRAIHLLFAANRWELSSLIESTISPSPPSTFTSTPSASPPSSSQPPLPTQPTTIIADRYSFSGIAFSASKGLPYSWCLSPEISLPSPDLVIFLDISPSAARSRGGYGEERYEKEEMQVRVREIFKRIGEDLNREDEKSVRGSKRWVTIDAGRSKEEVQADIWKLVEPLIGGVDAPLGRLWEEKLASSS